MKLRIWTLIACVLGITSLAAGQIPGLDAADQETRLTLTSETRPKIARRGEVIEVTHRATLIPGWHIYGRLEENGQPTTIAISELGGLEALGPADIPIGEPHEQFGMHSYYLDGEVVIRQRFAVPLGAALGKGKVSGKLEYLACDDANCDQPTHAAFALDFEVEDGAPRKDFARKKAEVLAMQLDKTTRRGEAGALVLLVEVRPGYHIYGAKESGGVATSVTVTNADELKARGGSFGAALVPEGVPHDANGIVTHDLSGKVTIRLPFTVAADAKAHDVVEAKLQFDYQVCDEKSCDMPASVALATSFPIEGGEAREDRAPALSDTTKDAPKKNATDQKGQAETGAKSAAGVAGDTGRGGAAGRSEGLWQLVLLAIGGALFALAMPCTYPMIPITISFFTKQAEARGGKVLPLALVYGAGIVLMFVVIAAVLSNVIVPFAAHWITNLVIGVAFLVFALSLFGVIDLQPPRFLMNAAGKASTQGGYIGVFLMGATLVISSFTCTAPFVGNIRAVGAQGGRAEAMLGMGIFGVVMAT
nr:protein-disulfide reductase DsbD family protein [Planctomycetota bacterium]